MIEIHYGNPNIKALKISGDCSPEGQQEMGDSLINFARYMSSCSINKDATPIKFKTWSEHIITRIVRRIVEDESLCKSIGIFYLEKKIMVDSHGIHDWPRGFMDNMICDQAIILDTIRKNEGRENVF